MLDNKKIYQMTKISLYENGPGKKEQRMNHFSKKGYINLKMLESFVLISIAYVLAAGLYCVRFLSDIMVKGLEFQFSNVVVRLFIGYIFITVLYEFVCYHHYKKRYKEMNHNIVAYDKKLANLQQYLKHKDKTS